METFVVVAVLVGALLHAGWNTLIKAGGDKELDVALVHSLGALVCLPLLAWTGLPPREAWPFLAVSLCIHVAYYVTLTGAYQHGDLGATYPIMRGSAPMLVALGSATVLGESLSAAAWVGVCAITLGVMLVGLSRPAEALHHRRALGFALANACVIAGYTFVDGTGVRVAASAGGTVPAPSEWSPTTRCTRVASSSVTPPTRRPGSSGCATPSASRSCSSPTCRDS